MSFMMRNTSPVGWIPLLAIKVLFEGSFGPFLIAGIFVAVPLIFFNVCVDTFFFRGIIDGKEWVLTSYNFVQMNVLENLSIFFGTEPFWFYIVGYAPEIFTVLYPAMLISVWTHMRSM